MFKKFEYGIRVVVKLAEGAIAGDVPLFDLRLESLEQAENMAMAIASQIGKIDQLILTDPMNPMIFIALSKKVLSNNPVFVSGFLKDSQTIH